MRGFVALLFAVCAAFGATAEESIEIAHAPKRALLISGLEWDRWLSFLDTEDAAVVTIDYMHFPPHVWDEVMALCAGDAKYECSMETSVEILRNMHHSSGARMYWTPVSVKRLK